MIKHRAINALKFTSYILILIVLVMSAQANSRQRRTVEAIARDSMARDANFKHLLASNDQQTLILCNLILHNNVDLSNDDSTTVETICKEQVKQLTASNGGSVSQTPQNSSQNSTGNLSAPKSSSTNSTPSKAPAQSNNVQQPPAAPKPSTFQRILNKVTGIF